MAENNSFASNAMRSNGPTMSMIENSSGLGVGNYKGVMLCNRPFGGSTVPGNIGVKTVEKQQFACGLVSEPIGINVRIAATNKYQKRTDKNSVLTKHKKWLHDLQKQKDRLAEEVDAKIISEEEKKTKFQEHEKRMRAVARSLLAAEEKATSDDKESSTEHPETKNQEEEIDRMMEALAKNKNNISFEADSKKPSTASSHGSKASAKPAWAMTEKACEDADLDIEDGDDLINFAKSLDFDKYIGDIEVKSMMERLRKRIVEYEREIANDEARGVDAEQRAARREMLALMGETESSLHSEQFGKNYTENIAMTAAKALLEEEDELQAVHSTKSVSVLLKQAKDKISAVKDSVRKDVPPTEAKVWNEPIIVVHDSSDGTRLENQKDISKLPYMHRNPAV